MDGNPQSKIIIAFTGKRKAGKSEAIVEFRKLDSRFVKVGFAHTLKDMFATDLDIDYMDLYDNKKKEFYRGLLQEYASRKRKEDPEVFIKPVLSIIERNQFVLIEDLRFYNELKALQPYNIKIIMIIASIQARKERGFSFDPLIDNHESEMEVADLSVDTVRKMNGYCIDNSKNNDSSQHLKREVHILYQRLTTK